MFNLFDRSARHRRQPAVAGAMLGGVLSIASFPTLFLNEGRAVKTARSLQEGAASVVSIDGNQVDPSCEGKFVHLSGEARTDETLTDDVFGVEVNAIRLIRSVEMYQWKELEEKVTRKVDGKSKTETRFAYEKIWADSPLDSSKYHEPSGHENPASFPFGSSRILVVNGCSRGRSTLAAPATKATSILRCSPTTGVPALLAPAGWFGARFAPTDESLPKFARSKAAASTTR